MAIFATANFTGTDDATLQVADTNFTLHSSYTVNSVITSNRCRNSATAGLSCYYHSGVSANADYSASLDIYAASNSANSQSGAACRLSTSDNTMYLARYIQGTGWTLAKIVSGTFTQLGSTYAQTLTVGNIYNVKVQAVGSTIKMFVDGVERVSVTDTAITTAGKAGLRSQLGTATTGYHLDNFQAIDASSTSSVYSDLALIWDMAGSVMGDLSLKWDLLNSVDGDLSVRFDVLSQVFADLAVQWDVFTEVNGDLSILFDMRNMVASDLQILWDSAGTVFSDLALRWSMGDLGGKITIIGSSFRRFIQ
ncbi:MAG: laminin G sub domain [Geobacteraceae bacterium]|nr:MAG: laminin G sub domain [Geobacteraceae bacterium]